MGKRRIVEPGLRVMITRRAVCRFYLFRPDREIRQAFLYCLGLAANHYGVKLHAVCLMSTHYHLLATDVRGVYPDFLHEFHRLFANVTKVLRGWGNEVFDASGTSVVDLRTDGAVIDKYAYVIVNPVACGAVRYAREWPGLVTRMNELGGTSFVVDRPERYFDAEGEMPERVQVDFELDPVLVAAHGERGALTLIADAIEEKEREARDAVVEKGHTFLGAARVTKTSPYERAKAYEVFGALNPTFATKGGGKQAYLDAAERVLAFHAEYREAWLRWRAGEREVVFPRGTWLMRVRYGVRCADPPL